MANKFYIVPNVRSKSASIKESSGIEFLCPTNTVMTGRWHKGDENGQTQYEYATLKAIDEYGNIVQAKIEVTDIRWSSELKESSGSGFQAPHLLIALLSGDGIKETKMEERNMQLL